MSTTAPFSIADYERMIANGAFEGPKTKRLELIHGELRDMSPIGPAHGEMMTCLTDWSYDVTSRQNVKVRVQSSIGIPRLASAPEPDIVWAAAKSYSKRRPESSEVLLLIEVAESSLLYDLGEKTHLYATAGIEDYWGVDILHRQVHVHRAPQMAGYGSIRVYQAGDVISSLNVENAKLDVSGLFTSLG